MFGGLIYADDFQEVWIKLKQRGAKFIWSKFNFNAKKRTISAFSANFEHANWWIIPEIKQRFNAKITGDKNITYEQYVTEKYIDQQLPTVMVSLGCGTGNHELTFAKLNKNLYVKGYDISEKLISIGHANVKRDDIKNASFFAGDVYKLPLENESVDIFLFNASLHHFKNVEHFVTHKILPALKKNGLIIINEYVGPNRLNFSKLQVAFCNEVLQTKIPLAFRKILLSDITKNKIYRHGAIRMIVSDPSECVDAQKILPVMHKYFNTIEEKELGGNILMPVLKHISHHFIHEGKDCLEQLCKIEDKYLESHPSQFVFGIYSKK